MSTLQDNSCKLHCAKPNVLEFMLQVIASASAQNVSMEKGGARFQKKRDDDGYSSTEEETEALKVGKEEVDIDVGTETLNLLEWPKVCIQVAEFASTSMAVAQARAGSLPIGTSVAESEELQAQTAAAQSLPSPLDFSDIADLRGFIEDAHSGNVCELDQFCQVRMTLAAVRRLYHQVMGNEDITSNEPGVSGV